MENLTETLQLDDIAQVALTVTDLAQATAFIATCWACASCSTREA